MGWRAVVVVVVAALLGAGAGGLAVQHHELNLREAEAAAVAAAPPTTVSAATSWFAGAASQACESLHPWYVALGIAIYTLPKDRAVVLHPAAALKLIPTTEAAFQSVLPLANPVGAAELQFLLTYLSRSSALLREASTAAAFGTAVKPWITARLIGDFGIAARTAKNCATA